MANPLSKLIHPWYPANAIGFETGGDDVSTVAIDKFGNAGKSAIITSPIFAIWFGMVNMARAPAAKCGP